MDNMKQGRGIATFNLVRIDTLHTADAMPRFFIDLICFKQYGYQDILRSNKITIEHSDDGNILNDFHNKDEKEEDYDGHSNSDDSNQYDEEEIEKNTLIISIAELYNNYAKENCFSKHDIFYIHCGVICTI